MAICMAVMERDYPGLKDADKAIVTKQIRAGYLFLSAVLFEPPMEFWDLPQDFIGNQREAEEVARGAVRVSLGAGNDAAQIDDFLVSLQDTLLKLQRLTAIAV